MQTCRIDQGTGLSQQGHHRGLAHSAEGIQQARISTSVGPDRQQRPWEEDRHPTGALWCLALQLCSWSNPEALTGTADQWIRLISLLLQRGAVLRDPKHSKIRTLAARQLQTTSITMQLHQAEWADVRHTIATRVASMLGLLAAHEEAKVHASRLLAKLARRTMGAAGGCEGDREGAKSGHFRWIGKGHEFGS